MHIKEDYLEVKKKFRTDNWSDANVSCGYRLHPAMYIFGTAYKTLDTELMNRRTDSLWCKVWEKQSLITAASKLFKWFKASI
jgi:hypothetical protein